MHFNKHNKSWFNSTTKLVFDEFNEMTVVLLPRYQNYFVEFLEIFSKEFKRSVFMGLFVYLEFYTNAMYHRNACLLTILIKTILGSFLNSFKILACIHTTHSFTMVTAF